jgi:hypothetical protein
VSENDDVRRMTAVAAATRLLDKGCKAGSPGGDPVYKALLARYEGDADLRLALAQVAEGRDLVVHEVSQTYGVTVTAKEACEWALTPSKIDGWTYSPEPMRGVLGAVMPFIAAVFYPTSAVLEDVTLAPDPLTARAIRTELLKACERRRAAHPDAKDDAIVRRGEEASQMAWEIILNLTPKDDRGSGAKGDRIRIRKIADLDDAVDVALRLLLDWGYLRQQGPDRFYPTRRFQVVVRETLLPSFYSAARQAANPQA